MTPCEKFELQMNLKKIADHYGFTSQADMLTEEAAEFTVALNKLRRGYIEAYDCIIEELADVLVVAEQLKYIISDDKIESIMLEKSRRQIKRINDEKN